MPLGTRLDQKQHSISFQLLNNQSALNDSVHIDPIDDLTENMYVYVIFSPGVTAGTVIVESADSSSFTGEWASLVVLPFVTANKQHVVQITGGLAAVRTRISVAIVGGTVSSKLFATKRNWR